MFGQGGGTGERKGVHKVLVSLKGWGNSNPTDPFAILEPRYITQSCHTFRSVFRRLFNNKQFASSRTSKSRLGNYEMFGRATQLVDSQDYFRY